MFLVFNSEVRMGRFREHAVEEKRKLRSYRQKRKREQSLGSPGDGVNKRSSYEYKQFLSVGLFIVRQYADSAREEVTASSHDQAVALSRCLAADRASPHRLADDRSCPTQLAESFFGWMERKEVAKVSQGRVFEATRTEKCSENYRARYFQRETNELRNRDTENVFEKKASFRSRWQEERKKKTSKEGTWWYWS